MKYRTTGAHPRTFSGVDAVGVVRQMHRCAWLTPPRKGDYMAAVAERCGELGFPGVDSSTCARFLDSLERFGFIARAED